MADFMLNVAQAINALNANLARQSVVTNKNLLAISSSLAALTIVLDKSIGLMAEAVPGSPRNSVAGTASALTNVAELLEEMKKTQDDLVSNLAELSTTVKATNNTLGDMATVQSIAVADQMSTNSFQKQETLAALKRNNIEPAPLPTIQEVIKETVANSSIMRASAEFQGAVSDTTNAILTKITDYVKQSALYTWGNEQLTSLWTSLGLSRTAKAVVNPAATMATQRRNLVNAKTKAGLWTPSSSEFTYYP